MGQQQPFCQERCSNAQECLVVGYGPDIEEGYRNADEYAEELLSLKHQPIQADMQESRRLLQAQAKLFESTFNGDLEALVVLLKQPLGKEALKLREPDDGNTALHVAAAEGQLQAAAELLKAGADPEMTNFIGQKPVHMAAPGTNVHSLLQAHSEPCHTAVGLQAEPRPWR